MTIEHTSDKNLDRIQFRFVNKYPDLDTTQDASGVFVDEITQAMYNLFKTGYMSHPSFNNGGIHLIVKETDAGIEMAKDPHFHISYRGALIEKSRLEAKYGAKFHIFSSLAGSDGLRDKLIAGTKASRRDRKQEPMLVFSPPDVVLPD